MSSKEKKSSCKDHKSLEDKFSITGHVWTFRFLGSCEKKSPPEEITLQTKVPVFTLSMNSMYILYLYFLRETVIGAICLLHLVGQGQLDFYSCMWGIIAISLNL